MMGALQSLIATFAGVAVAVFSNGTVTRLAVLMTAGALASWLSLAWAKRAASG